eukprot:3630936-Amphidinium_carterae.1
MGVEFPVDPPFCNKVTDVSIHPESTTNIVAPGNADDGSVKTGAARGFASTLTFQVSLGIGKPRNRPK